MSETPKRKVVITGRMDPDLLARAKAMVYWTPGLTFSRMMEDALKVYLEEMEKKSPPLKPAPGPLRNGRPVNMRGAK